MNKLKIQNKVLWVAVMLLAVGGIALVANAYSGSAQIVAESGATINVYGGASQKLGSEEAVLGAAVASDASHLSQEPKPTALGATYFSGAIETDGAAYLDSTLTVAGASDFKAITYLESSSNLTATTSITSAMSGKTFYISGNTSTWTLPATSSAIIGATYRFVVGGALAVTSSVKTAGGADEIEGTLIVAGAVVDCDAEDSVDFGASLENIGDYVEFRWSGTYWMIGDSGALTALSLACTKT